VSVAGGAGGATSARARRSSSTPSTGTRASVSRGRETCAVITASTPASIARRNGRSSTASSSLRLLSMTGRPRCESTSVSPCPGKCFAVVIPPASRAPSTYATPRRATSSGSAPKLRAAMTGLSAFEFTSSTGAKLSGTPTASASVAVMRPYSRAHRASPIAPKAIVGGISVPPPCRRRLGSAYCPPRRMPGPPLSKSETKSRGSSERAWRTLPRAAKASGPPMER